MQKNGLPEAALLKRNRRRRIWRKIVGALACAVVFCTTYALILPAVTLTREDRVLQCTFSVHQHTEECYDSAHNLICGKAAFAVHTHNGDCYDNEGNLVCRLPEIEAHVHTEECYREERVLTCTLEGEHYHSTDCYTFEQGPLVCANEDPDHRHTDECYQGTWVLTCGLEEGEHIHSDACYTTERTLVCGESAVLHTHTDECYDENGRLTCGQLQVEEHVHGDGCFVPVQDAHPDLAGFYEPYSGRNAAEAYLRDERRQRQSTPESAEAAGQPMGQDAGTDPAGEGGPTPAPENRYDLAEYITYVTVQRRQPGEKLWQNIVDNNVRVGDEILLDINYVIDGGTLDKDHRSVTYQLPSEIGIVRTTSGKVYHGEDEEIGEYTIGLDGRVTITFNEAFATSNNEGSQIVGHIGVESTVEAMGGKEGGTITFKITEEVTLNVKNPEGDLEVTKTSCHVKPVEGKLDYEIRVTSAGGTSSEVVLEDIPENVTMTAGTLEIVDGAGQVVPYTVDNDGKYHLPAMGKNSEYVISYAAKSYVTAELIAATNTVQVSSTDTAGIPVTATDTTRDLFCKKIVEKSGKLDEEGKTVSWEVRLNYASLKVGTDPDVYERLDISGWTLSDTLDGEEYTGSVTISPNPDGSIEGDTLTVGLPYIFPKESPRVEYTVRYTTEGSAETVNTATLTPPAEQGGGIGSTATPGEFTITKTAEGYSLQPPTADGRTLIEANWEVTVDATDCTIPTDRTSNILGKNIKYWPNNGYWYFRDFARTSGGGAVLHYYAPEQIEEAATHISEAIRQSGYTGNYYIFGCLNGISDQNIQYTVLVAKGGPSPDSFWDDDYLNNGPSGRTLYDGVNRNYIYVFFDSPLERGTSFSFRYATTADITNNIGNSLIQNSALLYYTNIGNLDTGAIYQWYYPVAKKYDLRPAAANPGEKTSYELGAIPLYNRGDDINYENVLMWRIQINFPADRSYDAPVKIIEQLPEGVKLLQLETYKSASDHSQGIRLTNMYGLYGSFVDSGKETVFKGSRYYFGEETGTRHTYDSANGGYIIAQDENTCQEVWGGYELTCEKNGETYTITLPEKLANALQGGTGTIYVWTQIENTDAKTWNAIERSFENTVTVKTGEETLGIASQEQVVRQGVIEKTCSYNMDSDTDKRIPYEITINAMGQDLMEDSDTLTLTDVLSYQTVSGSVSATLDYEKLRVTSVDDGEDLTSICPYTVTEGSVEKTEEDPVTGKDVTNTYTTYTLEMRVPDARALKIAYTYQLNGNGIVNALSNTASVEGTGSDEATAPGPEEIIVQKGQADAEMAGINVYKVAANSFGTAVPGVKFELWQWEGEWKNTGRTFETNEEGSFSIQDLAENTAYKLVETSTPKGYLLPSEEAMEKDPYTFFCGSTVLANRVPQGFNGKTLNDGDKLTIPNTPVWYELPETGGAGTAPYTLCGLLLALGGGILLLHRKNKGRKEAAVPD